MSKKKTHEEYIAELAQVNLNIAVIERYVNANTPILHQCLIDGHMWLTTPHNVLCGSGCPMCCGNIKKTTEEYIQELSAINPNIEVIEEYINARTPIEHKCKIDGYRWKATPVSVLRGNGCAKCAGNAKRTTEAYTTELAQVNPNVVVLGVYVNALTPILHRCIIDGHEWTATPSNLLGGQGCPKCATRLLSQQFSKQHEQYVQEVVVVNPDIEVVGTYVNSHTAILHRCKNDGHEWMARPSNILSGKGCPKCKESQGEKQVCEWLRVHGFECKYQHSLEGCVDKKFLPFDFYIPQYNICIEYDGIQHYEPVDFAGKGKEWALNRFNTTQHHDRIKTEYCHNNNIPLLRIPYYANVEDELEKFFIHFNIVT